MKDPKRIPEMLDEIKKAWEKHPNVRLGQLLDAIISRSPHPIFYIEDEDLLERIRGF